MSSTDEGSLSVATHSSDDGESKERRNREDRLDGGRGARPARRRVTRGQGEAARPDSRISEGDYRPSSAENWSEPRAYDRGYSIADGGRIGARGAPVAYGYGRMPGEIAAAGLPVPLPAMATTDARQAAAVAGLRAQAKATRETLAAARQQLAASTALRYASISTSLRLFCDVVCAFQGLT